MKRSFSCEMGSLWSTRLLFASHRMQAGIQARNQPLCPVQAALGGVKPQSNNLSNRSPGIEIDIRWQMRADGILPLLHRPCSPLQKLQCFGSREVIHKADGAGQEVQPRITAGERGPEKVEIHLLSSVGQFILRLRWTAGATRSAMAAQKTFGSHCFERVVNGTSCRCGPFMRPPGFQVSANLIPVRSASPMHCPENQ